MEGYASKVNLAQGEKAYLKRQDLNIRNTMLTNVPIKASKNGTPTKNSEIQ